MKFLILVLLISSWANGQQAQGQVPVQQQQVPAGQVPVQQVPVGQQVPTGQQVPSQQGQAPPQQKPPAPAQVPPQQMAPQQMPPQQMPPQQMPPQQMPPQQMPPQHMPPQQMHPGQVPMHPGQVPMHPGQVPMHPGQMPIHPGQMPIHPGQLPPQVNPQVFQPVPMPQFEPPKPIMSGDVEIPPPPVAMEYKVHVDPGKEECYYQYVDKLATIYVSFQVLRGGDGMAGFAIRDPVGVLIHPYQWKPSSEYQEVSSTGGFYGICVDNQFSRFAAKLVNIYIATFRYDQWEKFSQELKDIDVSAENCTRILQGVDKRIHEILQHQQLTRGREARDFNLLLDNNSYVQYWSLAQIVIVVSAFVVQVYFVKKLFDTKTGVRGRI